MLDSFPTGVTAYEKIFMEVEGTRGAMEDIISNVRITLITQVSSA